jgi:N-acetylneuraminic acid mutarotase/uncharacterized GH25 family protein
MIRRFAALLLAGFIAATAQAHFVFVLPSKDATTAEVVMSDELAVDDAIDVAKLAGGKLFVRDSGGKDTPVEHRQEKHSLTAKLPGSGPRVVFGSVNYGVKQKGDEKPYLLAYHPKAILGDVPAEKSAIGEKLPAEILPIREGNKVRFQLVAAGKVVTETEINVLMPDGSKAKMKSDKNGRTEALEGAGRYGAWARQFEPKSGELGGKKYDEVRNYATLVVDVSGSALPPLPVAVSSLGAIASDGYLYVYGGHAGKTHSYDTKTVIGTFQRLKLDGGTKWEELPGGSILQGMNLTAHGGKIYRIGGMQPRNEPGTPADNHSVADVVRFDPKVGKWETMPSLPVGRSSHDVVVSGDKLVVVGGWEQKGKGQKAVWHETTLVLDLAAKNPEWKSIPQPFKRRALTAAAVGSKVYVIAGLGEQISQKRVDVLDLETGKWSMGPEIPGDKVGFSPAAGTVNGRVIVNTFEGPLYRLSTAGDAWEKVGTVAHKRMVGRLVPHGTDSVVLVGGASSMGNVGEVEVIKLSATAETSSTGGR